MSSNTEEDLALVIVIIFLGIGEGGGVTKWGGGVRTAVGDVEGEIGGEVAAIVEGIEGLEADKGIEIGTEEGEGGDVAVGDAGDEGAVAGRASTVEGGEEGKA